jgi:hypothetical protein
MAARMEVEQSQPKLLAALHLIEEGVAGFIKRLLYRVTQVNQIAVMRQDLPRTEVVFFARGFEIIDGFSRERRGAPLALVFCEQGESGRLNLSGANGSISKTACCADVRSNIFHKGTPVKPAGGMQTLMIAG